MIDADGGTEAIRWGAGVVMLALASLSDLRTRRVANAFWVPFLAIALVLDVAALASADTLARFHLAIALVVVVVLYLLWRLRLFGGADAKGLMVLALLVPFPSTNPASLVPTLDAVTNGTLAIVLVPLGFAAWNLGHGRWAGAATFLGTPMARTVAQASHVWPLQRVIDGKVQWRLWPRIGESYEGVYADLALAGVESVWVTPKLPLMVALAGGLAAAGLWGNLAWRAMDALL